LTRLVVKIGMVSNCLIFLAAFQNYFGNSID